MTLWHYDIMALCCNIFYVNARTYSLKSIPLFEGGKHLPENKKRIITRCDFVAYGQGMQKTLQRFCSKKRNQKSRLITIDTNVAILLTELFFYLVILAAASPWLRRSWSPNYSVLVKYENTIQHLYLPV
jgi:hypothetical protein